MRISLSSLTVLLLACLISIPVIRASPAEKGEAQTKVTAFTHATIYTAIGDQPIENATLVISGGKIVDVGGKEATPIPKGAEIVNMKGLVIIPGLVDTHSHIGLYSKPAVSANSDGNEMSSPVQSAVRAIDSIDPNDPGIRMAVAGGITTANIMPGSGNVIGGSTLYVKLRGHNVEEMRINGKRGDVEVVGGLKMANGENPKGYGKNRKEAPFTRMKIAALQREAFMKAREYMKKRAADPKTDRDIALEPLVEVLEKKRTVHFHCHRADDLLTAIRIAEEFDFEMVLQHATEGYRVADILAKKKIPVSLTLLDSPGGKAETMGLLEENAAVLDKAGVQVTINTDDFVTDSRLFLRTGAIAVRGGMNEAAALRALTLTPARLMHLDHRIGSLEKTKDADFVVLSGKPFSVYTKVQETWIDGVKRFDSSIPNQKAYRDGGWAMPLNARLPNSSRDVTGEPVTVATIDAGKIRRDPKDPTQLVVVTPRLLTGKLENDRGITAIEVCRGKIKSVVSVLKEANLEIEKEIPVIRANYVTAGLIDSFTTAGLSGAWNIPADQDQDENSDPNQADLRVIDGFNPQEPLLEFLRQNGVSVVHTTGGRHNILAGTSAVFRTDGRSADTALKPGFAVLVNLGETVKGGKVQTRMGVAALVRKAFADAQNYQASPGRKPGGNTATHAKHEALLPALEGKMPVIFAAHRADDIRTALRIAEEFKLRPMIALGTEAYMLADELAKKKVPVIVHPTMQRAGSSMETINTLMANAAYLKAAGVDVVFSSAFEGYVPKNRNIRAEAGVAIANGMSHTQALRCCTLDAAKLLGIDADCGTVEVGKLADLVLYDGDPFETTTHVTHTILNGKVVYDRTEYLKLPFERRILPLVEAGKGAGCCLGIW